MSSGAEHTIRLASWTTTKIFRLICPSVLSKLCAHNSITSLAKVTRTRVEYGFQWVYFGGASDPVAYRHGKEILAKRLTGSALKAELERIFEIYGK